MDLLEAAKARHAVRAYKAQPIDKAAIDALNEEIGKINAESGLNLQLVLNETKAFSGMMARYGKFKNANNYIAVIGKNDKDLPVKAGYYGERLVLFAQTLGLNTCWVAVSYSKVKDAYKIGPGEKLLVVISIGYGETQGVPHKSKAFGAVCKEKGNMPEWFINGVNGALTAPTAMNQQKFSFSLNEGKVKLKAGTGFYTKLDAGIVKYHFELAAGKENFEWA